MAFVERLESELPVCSFQRSFMARNGKIKVLLVLRHVCEGDDDVLVDKYEQGKKKAQSDGTQRAYSRQFIKWRVVEDWTIVDTKYRNYGEDENVTNHQPATLKKKKVLLELQKDENTIKEIAAIFSFFFSLSRFIKQEFFYVTVVSSKVPKCSAVSFFWRERSLR